MLRMQAVVRGVVVAWQMLFFARGLAFIGLHQCHHMTQSMSRIPVLLEAGLVFVDKPTVEANI